MRVNAFVNRTGKFFTLKIDVPNMRVTLIWGKLGLKGTTKVKFFNDRASLREFADKVIDARLAAGFVLIASA